MNHDFVSLREEECRVALEEDSCVFKCRLEWGDWNGWATPYFTLDQALALSNSPLISVAEYREEDDVFVTQFADGVGEDDIEEWRSVEIDGVKYYPVGAGSWAWADYEALSEQEEVKFF